MNDSMIGMKPLVGLPKSAFGFAGDEDGLRLSPEGAIEQAVYQILLGVGEDPERDGLKDTPSRVTRMYAEMLEGYALEAKSVVNGALFDVEYGAGEMVVVEGQHSCASLRGVKKHGVNMTTTAQRGKFLGDPRLREEFYRLVGK